MPPKSPSSPHRTFAVDRPRAIDFARTRLRWEVWLVLGVSVGQSALYSALALIRTTLDAVARNQSVGQAQTQLNPAQDAQPLWDALYQLLGILFTVVLIGLVVYLLWEPGENALRRIGLDLRHLGGDASRALLLASAIGVPGLGLYVLGRALGLSVQVQAAPLNPAWYTVPLLLLAAARAGLLEEVVFEGYLFDRLRRLGWSWWTIILTAAALRGVYHAYQGVPAVVGNAVMGVVFGWCYRRWGRVMPLVIAHFLIDAVAFAGYPIAVSLWPGVFA